jgi:hypothetical protein
MKQTIQSRTPKQPEWGCRVTLMVVAILALSNVASHAVTWIWWSPFPLTPIPLPPIPLPIF